MRTNTKLTILINILDRHNLKLQITTISRENSITLSTIAAVLLLVISLIKIIDLTQVILRISIATAKILIQTSNRRIQDLIHKEATLLAQSIEVESVHLTTTNNNKLMSSNPLIVLHMLGNNNNNNSMNQWKLKNNMLT